MNIYILEDDLLQRNRLEKVIKNMASKNGIAYKTLFTTAKPESLLKEIKAVSEHNMYFLDLEIEQQSRKGFEVAQQIRKVDPYGTVVFVTTHSELAPKTFAYRVSAMDFIEKEQDDAEFQKRVEGCLLQANDYKKQKLLYFKEDVSCFVSRRLLKETESKVGL